MAFRIPGAPPRQALRSTALALASRCWRARDGGTDLPCQLCALLATHERAAGGRRRAVTAVAAWRRPPRPRCPTPGATVQNVILFPLGLTSHRSPAASPLPGHLLAAEGPAGKWAALAALAVTGAAFACWLACRPPRTARSAAVLLAAGLAAAVTLAPAARWGYYAYPLALLGWLRLSAPPGRRSYSSERALATPSASAVASSGGASTGADAVPASG